MKYVEHILSKEPHERRRHALAWAAALTAVFFVAWIVTLGPRINSDAAARTAEDQQQAAANAATMTQLHISPDSVYGY